MPSLRWALLVAAPVALATKMTWVSLGSKYPQAVCNDGSSAGYYWRAALPKALPVWLVFLEGGGWCYSQETCAKRSQDLTSSTGYPEQTDEEGIFNSSDPRLRDANLAFVKYCTSDAHTGAAPGPLFDSAPVFKGGMNGHAVLQAVWDDMVSRGLGGAPGTVALFGGSSAGGRGALFNCDAMGARVKAALAQSGKLANLGQFSCFPDSAMWLDVQPFVTSMSSPATITQEAFALMNAAAVVPANSPACAAAYPGAEMWKCLFGSYALPYVQTRRWFMNTYLYDSYQLGSLLGVQAPPWSGAVAAFAEAFRANMTAALTREVPLDADHGDVSGACYAHTNTGSSKFTWQWVDGTTLDSALVGWLFNDDGRSSRLFIDTTPGPNNPNCTAPTLSA